MKYVANPVEVDAFKIVEILPLPQDGSEDLSLKLENGETVKATYDMVCQMPGVSVGDYWVIQSDAYVYLNPKAVFERKYSPKPMEASA